MDNGSDDERARRSQELQNLVEKLRKQRQTKMPQTADDSESGTDESPKDYIERLMRDLANRPPKEDDRPKS